MIVFFHIPTTNQISNNTLALLITMEKIRLCIAGVTGWIGKPLARAVIKSVDFDLVGGVSRKNSDDDLGKILEIPGFSLTISESVSEALNTKTDVLIDYTSPDLVWVSKHDLRSDYVPGQSDGMCLYSIK